MPTGSFITYSAGPVAGATSYEWTLPTPFDVVTTFDTSGDYWQMQPTDGRNLVAFTGHAEISGDVTFRGVNRCGPGPMSTIQVEHGYSDDTFIGPAQQ